ncbi:MAG: hypothetical protein JW982_05765 [Spirochaetes bacterium]|nr:hypothetical protein [Spirochaetota bacterium]
MKNLFMYVLFSVLIISGCTTSGAAVQTAKYDVKKYEYNKSDRYALFLVKTESYTTDGGIYHKKYIDQLYGTVRLLMDEKQIVPVEGSVGFYYDDKKSKTNFYLGMDILCSESIVKNDGSYEENGRIAMQTYLKAVLEVIGSCVEIFDEEKIEGAVTGLVWKRNGKNELINVWASKNDIRLFLNNGLTLRGFIYRCIVTDSDGKIIRLTI